MKPLELGRWRIWVPRQSIRHFIWGWTMVVLLLLEGAQAWSPGLLGWLSPDLWLGLKMVLMAILLAWVLRQAFMPMRRLDKNLGALATHDAAQLDHQPHELRPLAQALHRLLQAQQALVDEQRQFLSNASHQLQTPFAVLRAQLQAVMAGQLPAHETLPKMLSTVDRASILVRQLLSLAKVEQMVRQAHWREVDLPAVTREVVLEFAPLLARKNLDFSLQAVPVRVCTDPWLLGELVRNLLSNAIQHSPENGALGLVVRVLPTGIELLVWDNGGGMDESIQARLFEPFQSASGASGVGLGLSICRQIALSMGAAVDLYNRVQDDRIVGVDAVVRWPQPAHPEAAEPTA